MIWILPGLFLAWTFAQLGAQAVWVTVLVTAVKVAGLLLLLAVVIFAGWLIVRLRRGGR